MRVPLAGGKLAERRRGDRLLVAQPREPEVIEFPGMRTLPMMSIVLDRRQNDVFHRTMLIALAIVLKGWR